MPGETGTEPHGTPSAVFVPVAKPASSSSFKFLLAVFLDGAAAKHPGAMRRGGFEAEPPSLAPAGTDAVTQEKHGRGAGTCPHRAQTEPSRTETASEDNSSMQAEASDLFPVNNSKLKKKKVFPFVNSIPWSRLNSLSSGKSRSARRSAARLRV